MSVWLLLFFYVFMKKFFSALSVVVLTMFNIISPTTYALEWDESGWSCFVVEDGFITSYTCSETNLTVPSSIDGVNITWIGAQAFRWKWLTSLTIEEWIKIIWKRAFAENKLTTINLPTSLESIEEAAFNKNLIEWNDAFIYTIWSKRLVSYAGTETTIVIPNDVTSIGASAFRDMWITNVTIPNGVTNIGYMAFAGNELNTLNLPTNILTIWAYAFERNNLSSIFLPNSIQEVDKEAFCDQESNSEVDAKIARDFSNEFDNTCLNVDRIYSLTFKDHENIISTWLYDDWETIVFPTWDYDWIWWFDGETQYSDWAVMPQKDLILNTKALSGCFIINNSNIIKYICDDTDIVIPNTVDGQIVVWIWTGVFEDRGVTSLTFETTSLENIYQNAFAYNKLTQVDIPDTVKYIWNSAFRSRDDDTSTKITTLKLWNSVKIIDEHAFAYNRITTLNIPSSVERIEKWAFRDNKNIKDLVIPSNVKFIWEAAFRNNDDMINLTIENWLEEIWTWAFYNDRLKNINIPNSVKYIRDSAFRNNTYNNYTVTIWNWLEELWQWAFCKWQAISPWETPICDDRNITIDSESLARLWWTAQIAIDHVDRDGPYLIINSYTYYTITFKDWDNVISSGKYLSWDTITYPADLRDNDKIFDGWDPNPTLMPAENLNINAKWINKATSGSCFLTTELSNWTLEITSYDISCGTDVVIPKKINWKTVTSIWAGCFQTTAPGITSVVLPYSVTNIWNLAFRACSSLGSVTITNPNTVIPEGSFRHSWIQIRFFVPSEISDETLDNSIKKWSSVISHVYTRWRLVYYKDGSTIIDAELYENNADLWDTMILDDKDWYKFIWWNGIPTNGKVISNLDLIAMWKDESSTVTPDECFWLKWPYWWKYWVNSYNENCWDEVVMPNTINWRPISTLSESPFRYKNIKKLVLPNTLETIWWWWAAYNPNLTEIVFPETLTSLWDGAFRNDGLTWNLVLPNSVTSIWQYSFYANTIDTVVIWDNLSSIWEYSFCGRSDWLTTKALLPKPISEYSWAFLTQLENACLEYAQICTIIFEDGSWNIISETTYWQWDEIIIPDFNTNRDWYEFLWWRWLPSDLKAKENQTITPLRKATWSDNPDECFIYDTDDSTLLDYVEWCGIDVVLPNKTKAIAENALRWKWLKSVILNDGLLVINDWALAMNDLTWITLPASITNFIPNSLSWNSNLKKVRNSNWTTPDECFTVHAGNWKYQITAYNINCGSDVVIPGTITSSVWWSVPTRIVWSIAGFWSSIEKVEIPNNVTRIATNTFYWANLSEITLHDWITEIWSNAFGWNTNLERVFIWSWLLTSWATIGWTVFCKNSSDTTRRVWIVDTGNYELLTEETKNKFDAICVDLEPKFIVTFNDNDWSLIEEKYFGSWETITLPEVADNSDGSVIWWVWLPKNGIVNWDLTLTAIRKLAGEDTPEECFTVENWAIIDYIESCWTNVVIPNNINGEDIESIWDNVFKNMGLTSLRLPEWLKKIWDNAFENNNLRTLIIPDSVTEIWDNAFNSNQLETLKLSKNIDSIWDSAFANNKLTAVRIPLSINEVGDSAFCNATNTPVEWLISEDFPEIKYWTFKNSCIELVKWLYLIIFDTAWGSTVPSIEWEYKDPINVEVPNPTRKWYQFMWWDKSLPSRMPADDTIITARREVIQPWYSGVWKRINTNDTEWHFAKDKDNNPVSAWNKSKPDIRNRILTRWDLAVVTDTIVTMFPNLIDNRPIINTNCTDYTDYQIFSNIEKKSTEKLCRVWIMWIHNDTKKPLTTFMINKIVPMNEFQLVMERTFVDYKDSILIDIMKEVQWRKDIDFFTVFEIITLLKNKL